MTATIGTLMKNIAAKMSVDTNCSASDGPAHLEKADGAKVAVMAETTSAAVARSSRFLWMEAARRWSSCVGPSVVEKLLALAGSSLEMGEVLDCVFLCASRSLRRSWASGGNEAASAAIASMQSLTS